MELKLEIRFANKEELRSVAEALLGIPLNTSTSSHEEETVTSDDDDLMEPVESPFAPKAEKPLTAKEMKALKDAEKKAAKEAKDAEAAQAREANRLAIEEEKKRILNSAPPQEHPEAATVHADISALGDKLMAFQGLDIAAKQAIINSCIKQVNGPDNVRPSAFPVAIAVPFKNALQAQIEALYTNPPMTGLV